MKKKDNLFINVILIILTLDVLSYSIFYILTYYIMIKQDILTTNYMTLNITEWFWHT
jgi:hypothetical protein